jgi:starch phosphorylase
MLPPRLSVLAELAENLWWTYDPEATDLFRSIDPYRFSRSHHNATALLSDVEQSRWDALAADAVFVARAVAVGERFRAFLAAPTWSQEAAAPLHASGVAYVSMEFGLHESVRLYSGGLGVLAGDHLRSASDLGVPLVGVSLLHRQGYFRQVLDDGRQLAAYPHAHLDRLPYRPCLGPDGTQLVVEVPIGGRNVKAQVWQLAVGRTRLLLLDTHVAGNTDADRALSSQLYGGGEELRIAQEVLLGFGAVAALDALGLRIGVWHLNEGHCAFVPLALVGHHLAAGASLHEALDEVRARCVFTTHTPVPAGHDRFGKELVTATLGRWAEAVGLAVPALLDLGRVKAGDEAETFCMTVLALKASAATNGVSVLHGRVSREMWAAMWPERPVAEVPIGAVTNGVHAGYWAAPEAAALFDRHLPGWRAAEWDEVCWARAEQIPPAELWALRRALRARLCDAVRARTGHAFDPDALTLGFARRFAPYKRGALLFSDPARLKALLDAHPIQIVYAGKAHPRDTGGQEILSTVLRWSADPAFRGRVVVLEDYDMAIGRLVTAGADVWVNNPRRPHEASGTSGQKVVLNGGLNLSVLDGWWPEGFDGTNGWAIGDGSEWTDEVAQDAADAESLYSTLEASVVPEWADRTGGLPLRWLRRVARCLATCPPKFTSHRMVRDYVLGTYLPRVGGLPRVSGLAPVSGRG